MEDEVYKRLAEERKRWDCQYYEINKAIHDLFYKWTNWEVEIEVYGVDGMQQARVENFLRNKKEIDADLSTIVNAIRTKIQAYTIITAYEREMRGKAFPDKILMQRLYRIIEENGGVATIVEEYTRIPYERGQPTP